MGDPHNLRAPNIKQRQPLPGHGTRLELLLAGIGTEAAEAQNVVYLSLTVRPYLI